MAIHATPVGGAETPTSPIPEIPSKGPMSREDAQVQTQGAIRQAEEFTHRMNHRDGAAHSGFPEKPFMGFDDDEGNDPQSHFDTPEPPDEI